MIKFSKTSYLKHLENILDTKKARANEPELRPSTLILWTIIFINCILMAGGIIAGIFCGQDIYFLITDEDIAEFKAEGLWLPIMMFLGLIMIYGWGTITAFDKVCHAQMKKSVEGKILSSELRSFYEDGIDEYYIYSVVSYFVKGHQYQREERHDYNTNNRKEAEKELIKIKQKNKATVFYDPQNPNLMTLDSHPKFTYSSFLLGIVLITGGTLLSILLGIILS